MAELVIPEGYALSRQKFTVTGKAGPAMITFGLHPGIDQDANAIAIGVRAAFVTLLGTWEMPNGWTMVDNEVVYRDGVLFAGLATGVTAGTGSSSTPSNSACLVRKNTGLVGAKFHGRSYFWPPSETNVGQDGQLTSSYVAAVQTAINTFKSDLAATGLGGIVLLHTDATPPTPLAGTNGYVLESKIATQRRRLRN